MAAFAGPSLMKLFALLLATGILCCLMARGALVSFPRTDYTVAVGQSLDLDVEINFEAGDAASDLFSFGVRLVPVGGTPFALDSIAVVPALDNFGIGGGANALIDPDPAVLGAKGNVINLQSPYMGSLLVTYTVQFIAVGSFPISLDFFNTLGPTEQIFVGGNGQELDPTVTFGNTLVTVIPEPGIGGLLLVASTGLFCRRRNSPRSGR